MSPEPGVPSAQAAPPAGPGHGPARSLVAAVLVGAALLAAAIVLAVAMADQPRLEPIPLPTVSVA